MEHAPYVPRTVRSPSDPPERKPISQSDGERQFGLKSHHFHAATGSSYCRVESVPRDLFVPVVPDDKLNPLFASVMRTAGHAPARQMVNDFFGRMTDVDGAFVREFQTHGFSPRVFELALFAYLEESGCSLERRGRTPDFVINGPDGVAIEVTTTNPAESAGFGPTAEDSAVNVGERANEFVFQIGKALSRKMRHQNKDGQHYWEMPNVFGRPFIIAVGAFHNPHSQLYTAPMLSEYLYGKRDTAGRTSTGELLIVPEPVSEHRYGGRSIPSGLFNFEAAAGVSGVLFSNAHTIALFNRIGFERGTWPRDIALMRYGDCYDYTPNAAHSAPFAYVVGDRPQSQRETFGEGLNLFVNPNATVPISSRVLPGIVTNELLESGLVETTTNGSFVPFWSRTEVYQGEGAPEHARRRQYQVLASAAPEN